MSAKSLVLLLAAGAMGLLCAFQRLFVLGFSAARFSVRRGRFPSDEKVAFWQPARSAIGRWGLMGSWPLLSSFGGACGLSWPFGIRWAGDWGASRNLIVREGSTPPAIIPHLAKGQIDSISRS